uniref:Breast cancer type 1 susceptibility protein n=1 Tax=Romanomermis culicivorax TaxID=13658 RepID=A0A915I2Q7_ROMCU
TPCDFQISKCNEIDAEHYSEIVAINVDPRKKLKNSSNNSIDHYAKINKKRRQTIEIAPMKRVEDFRPTSNETLVEKSPVLIEDMTNDTNRKNDKENVRESIKINEKVDSFNNMADEYFYDFAPFYRRRKKSSILDQMNQFMSLKRSSKKNSIRCDSVVVEEPLYANTIISTREAKLIRNDN